MKYIIELLRNFNEWTETTHHIKINEDGSGSLESTFTYEGFDFEFNSIEELEQKLLER